MSSGEMGLSGADARRLGQEGALRVRTFRLVLALAQQMRTAMDQRLRADGLTTQQAALITVVDALGVPSLSEVAHGLGTTHQNARQIADALDRKGFVRIELDPGDGRVRRLRTTARCHAYWEQRSATDQDHVVAWFDALTHTEVATLFDLLGRVRTDLRETGGE